MRVLGIETSCDETGVCLIETQENEKGLVLSVLGNQLYSQVAKHVEFGGVMPTLAKREHQKNLVPLLIKCLEEAFPFPSSSEEGRHSDDGVVRAVERVLQREPELLADFIKILPAIKKPEIDAIAVTNGPGLEPALWVGVNFAKALSALWSIPIIPTNHMEGHVVVASLDRIKTEDKNAKAKFLIKPTHYPAIALLVSGGHTQLVLTKDQMDYEIVGNTRDDAVGEAFDKVARMMGLPYPGGVQIYNYSEEFKKKAAGTPNFKFPRPMIHSKDLDFSFSGLKTSVLYTIKEIPELTEEIKQEIAFEFQNAAIDVLVSKTKKAIEQHHAKTLIVGGGVIANPEIRKALEKLSTEIEVNFLLPEISAATDNALMIAMAGFLNLQSGGKTTTDFIASGNLSL
jgi:N6-L-threonylcarbamoyladenine synthase